MCLGPRLLSLPAGVSHGGLFMWLKGFEVGPPNLLQVEEQGHKEFLVTKNVKTEWLNAEF